MTRLRFALCGKQIDVLLEPPLISLWLEGCLRKKRSLAAREPVYLWTNVELLWEEHSLVEIRYWASTDTLQVAINGKDVCVHGSSGEDSGQDTGSGSGFID